MDNQYMISETNNRLAVLLKEKLAQDFGITPEQVGMGVPGENSNLAVCIFLYDIQKYTDVQIQQKIPIGLSELQDPSTYYDLHYMLVPYSNSDLQYRMEEEIKLMDILIQWLVDLHYLDFGGMEVPISLNNVEMDEKIKIWGGINQQFHMALYCKVGPVEIQSARRKRVARVKDVQVNYVQA